MQLADLNCKSVVSQQSSTHADHCWPIQAVAAIVHAMCAPCDRLPLVWFGVDCITAILPNSGRYMAVPRSENTVEILLCIHRLL